jgi:hypothetical protein
MKGNPMTDQPGAAGARAAERMTEQARANAEYATAQVQETAERTTQQIRDFGERTAVAGRAFGELALDAYEETTKSLVEFEHRAADAAPVDWVKAAIGAHASFVQDVNAAYVKAARAILA